MENKLCSKCAEIIKNPRVNSPAHTSLLEIDSKVVANIGQPKYFSRKFECQSCGATLRNDDDKNDPFQWYLSTE